MKPETFTPYWSVIIDSPVESELQKVRDFIDNFPSPASDPTITLYCEMDHEGANLLIVHKTSRNCLMSFIFPTLTKDQVWKQIVEKLQSRVN